MKKLLSLLVLLLIACTSSVEKPVAAEKKPVKTSKIDYSVLRGNKSHIDSLFKYAAENEISIYVKQIGQDDLIKVAAKELPENIEASFNIFRDNMGHVIRIAESPNSANTDLYIGCTYYFDEAGRTFAFERQINTFNSVCTDGVLFETKTMYYNNKFKEVDSTYKLVDEDDKNMVKDSCRTVEYKYDVQPDLNTYYRVKKIPAN